MKKLLLALAAAAFATALGGVAQAQQLMGGDASFAPPATTTNRSITVTTGGTAQQVMAANTLRRSFYLFNPNATGVCWVSLTTTTPAANASGSLPIAALGGFGMEMNASTAAIYANCPTTGQFVTAWESQ